MKKIGILTEYYNSKNYGGNLQAYALCKFLNNQGYRSEQIQYKKTIDGKSENVGFLSRLIKKISDEGIWLFFTNRIKSLVEKIIKKTIAKNDYGCIANREKSFLEFNKGIPHGSNVYCDKNIGELNETYELFVVGSDQVWRDIRNKAYFLNFVDKSIPKISYAASVSRDDLTEEEKDFFGASLNTFKAISVREKETVGLLEKIVDVPTEWVVDPTLLLSKKEWDEVCGNRIIKGNYIFAFFIGEGVHNRRTVVEYAQKHNCIIVTIPYLRGKVDICDFFGFSSKNVVKLYDVSPRDFISLIRYADCVFTDSFHASVFSIVYEKQFVVFDRPERKSMSSRIRSLLDLYEIPERFCKQKGKRRISYIEELPSIDYSKNRKKADELIYLSKQFLYKNI